MNQPQLVYLTNIFLSYIFIKNVHVAMIFVLFFVFL